MLKHPLVVLMCLLIIAGTGSAQYAATRTVTGGGASSMMGAEFALAGTVGQTVIAENTGQIVAKNGFWYQVRADVSTAVGTPAAVPNSVTLFQNYPNPFAPTTSIRFSVSRQVHVTLSITDIMGREVAILVDEPMASGEYVATFHGEKLPAGTYLCRLVCSGHTVQRTMQLMK